MQRTQAAAKLCEILSKFSGLVHLLAHRHFLSLGGSAVTPSTYPFCRSLAGVTLDGIADPGELSYLCLCFTALTSLKFHYHGLVGEGPSDSIGPSPLPMHLQALRMRICNDISGHALSPLSALTRLTSLDLIVGGEVEDLDPIGALSRLRRLHLDLGFVVVGAQVAFLNALRSLEHLELPLMDPKDTNLAFAALACPLTRLSARCLPPLQSNQHYWPFIDLAFLSASCGSTLRSLEVDNYCITCFQPLWRRPSPG